MKIRVKRVVLKEIEERTEEGSAWIPRPWGYTLIQAVCRPIL